MKINKFIFPKKADQITFQADSCCKTEDDIL